MNAYHLIFLKLSIFSGNSLSSPATLCVMALKNPAKTRKYKKPQ
jgi:hypothetical protein